jgi:hypothetical protein
MGTAFIILHLVSAIYQQVVFNFRGETVIEISCALQIETSTIYVNASRNKLRSLLIYFVIEPLFENINRNLI